MSISLQNIKVHAALFTVALIYGANYSIAKIIVPEFIGPFGTIFFRVIVAGLLFAIIHAIWIKEKVTSRKDYIRLALCGMFGVAGNQLMFFKGLSITTPINASLVMQTAPVLVLILSYFTLSEKMNTSKVIGIILSLLGAVLLVGGPDLSFSSATVIGDLFIFLNACSYGIYLVLAKPLMAKYNALTIVKWIFFFGAIIVVPFSYKEVIQVDWQNVDSQFYLCLGYVVIGTTFLAYLLNAWGLKFVNASVVGIYIYLQPVLATGFAILIRGDELTLRTVLLSILIFIGVYLVSKKTN